MWVKGAERERKRELRERGKETERERGERENLKQAPCLAEPNAELDPTPLGS